MGLDPPVPQVLPCQRDLQDMSALSPPWGVWLTWTPSLGTERLFATLSFPHTCEVLAICGPGRVFHVLPKSYERKKENGSSES